jgi:uncharacterized protein YbjT (DUF2867 family)
LHVARDVFVTGGTGYLGRPLIAALLARGHTVRALTRQASASRLPAGAIPVAGNALEPAGWSERVAPADTFVHLIGTPHPSPLKAAQFQAVDLVSIKAAVEAATGAGIRHFVYVSVAHPAPMMHAFIEVRRQGEALVRSSGIAATILRPWYILGPGHRWPYVLLPLYALLRLLPSTRAGAERLALIPRRAVIDAMVRSIESPPAATTVLEAPQITSG